MSTAPVEPGGLQVDVVWSPAPRSVRVMSLRLAVGSTVADAVQQALLASDPPDATVPGACVTAVWGRLVAPATLLRDQDRVELLRPLQVDPKEARRLRHRSQPKPGKRSRLR